MLSNTEHSINMSNPIPPPQFFSPQPFAPINDIVNLWPIENEQPIEYPPFKKPRNFDDAPISIPNPRILPPNPPVPRGTGRIFFKTRLCAKYKLGTCPYGISCSFAHGIEDLRKPPPNWKEIVASQGNEGMGNMEEDQRTFGRIKRCNKFHNGEECPYGERCNFLHEDPTKFREDPGRFRESSATSIGTTGQPFDSRSTSDQSDGNGIGNSSVDFNQMNQKSFSWKTRICNKWETTGHCPFGDKCHFAHGREELQKFGYPDKAEMANPGTIPSKPPQNPGNDVSYCDTTIGDSSKRQVLRKKCLLKWKGPEKISRIYADWIDDLPLLRSSSSKVEN